MKKIIFTAAFVLMAISMFSQARQSSYTSVYDRTIDINEKSLAFGLTEAQFAAIKDEAYANPNFLQGKIFQEDQLIKDDVPMRYNAYADEIEIKKNVSDETYSALIKSPDIFVKIINEIYVFVPFNGSNEKGGYFNVLNDGKTYDLYKKTKAEFREPRKAQTSYQQDTPPSFVKATTYYLVKDGSFLEMPNSKSKILKMMDSKKNEMKKYIKDNNIDLDKEADLVKTIAYFDSLL
ncbi:MAG TPA: hypothetical protein PKH16_15630 [Aequorivita sp.]|jgi:hypothetical protein|nr:hypothetical protein [Aequorivita sp.]MBP40718.1 hypothetical protein [Aequorivita sp.]HBC05412.1 hypothetical protein [Aequorivita sp.]HNP69337.1 hypothetical protein [Aequorivita sp.]|tara:strand:+ start:5885 stop:6589 length:705 start_codon:yes stop_codon:yes gene_type:complete